MPLPSLKDQFGALIAASSVSCTQPELDQTNRPVVDLSGADLEGQAEEHLRLAVVRIDAFQLSDGDRAQRIVELVHAAQDVRRVGRVRRSRNRRHSHRVGVGSVVVADGDRVTAAISSDALEHEVLRLHIERHVNRQIESDDELVGNLKRAAAIFRGSVSR